MKEFASVIGANRVDTIEKELTELSKQEFAPTPLITGDDLAAAGLQPGKLFKAILDQVYDAQLENKVTTKNEAMKLAMDLANS
jgi:hypothetical protein